MERKRDFIEEMREVAKALGDDLSGYDTLLDCENRYRTTIANKAALIVVDDVWSKTDIEPLLAESPRSRFLFTTRDASIGHCVNAHQHRADLLDLEQSRELLASWANLPRENLPGPADYIIAECGRLPLALSVVGAMLRGKNIRFWSDALGRLRRADLSSLKKQLPQGQESFFKAVETSFQSLEPEMQKQYKALGVLLEDMAAPLPILETLWNVDTAEARNISNRLADLSLAQSDAEEESIRVHDLQLDYVRAQFPHREALDLIHGAVLLSSHVIDKDPEQFASQLVGRLLPHQDLPVIKQFAERIAEGTPKPWLRPIQANLHPPGTPLVRTLEGHPDLVQGVAVWDVGRGRELRSLQGHSSFSGLAVSADGRRAVFASHDITVKVWDVDIGALIATFTCDTVAHCCAFIADDQLIAGVAGGHVHFLRLEEPKHKD